MQAAIILKYFRKILHNLQMLMLSIVSHIMKGTTTNKAVQLLLRYIYSGNTMYLLVFLCENTSQSKYIFIKKTPISL